MSIAVDMDNVIADIETYFLSTYEKEYGQKVERKSLKGRPETEGFPKDVILKFLNTPGFFRNAPVMPGSQDAVKDLMQDFDVYIVSAAMQFPQSLPEKFDWLAEHFPFIHWKHIIFCGDKSKVNMDFMVDDHVKNLDAFKGKTILYTASHNTNVTGHQRADNWDEVVKIIRQLS
jgi:5'(3')-deoxyribonucleotidase